MIVLRHENQLYYPKLTIRSCLAIDKLFGDVTRPLLTAISVKTQLLLLSLSLEQYGLSDDELYEVADSVEDLSSLILEIYEEAGVINQNQVKLTIGRECEPTDNAFNDSVTLENHVIDLLGQCMSAGMREEEFYKSTFAQVTRYVEAYNKQQQNEWQEKACFDYQLASLIKIAIGSSIDRKVNFPSFEKAYPFVKDSHKAEVDKEWEMEVQRIKLREWAEQMNQKMTKTEKESC
ncbi:hypothetical protein GMB70_14360 [Turicibacter sanguinis]|nr:hypothetical protein [Turicibacter sanguinis]